MRYLSFIFLLIPFLLSSCKKEEKPVTDLPTITTLKDFALVPVSDASWVIYTQGIITGQGKIDTSYHKYTTIESTGVDTQVNGVTYYKYNVSYEIVYPSNPPPVAKSSYNVFIREDTLARTIKIAKAGFEEAPVVSFRDEEIGTVVNQKPQMEIKYIDSVIVEKQYLKRWVACNSYSRNMEWFYKAYGVGTQTGILLRDMVVEDGGQVTKTSFTYKKSTLNFVNDIAF